MHSTKLRFHNLDETGIICVRIEHGLFCDGHYAYQLSRLCKGSILASRINPLFAVIIISGLMFFDAGKYFYGDGRWDLVIYGAWV